VLRGYRIDPADRTHALRTLRSALHGFATLQASNGFQWDTHADESFALAYRFPGPGSARNRLLI